MKRLFTIAFVLTMLSTFGQKRSLGYNNETKRNSGIVVTVGGLGFTTAAILESGSSYGTNITTVQSTPTTSQKVSYVIPPVWQQTPRNIMFVVGVTLTITGLLTIASK